MWLQRQFRNLDQAPNRVSKIYAPVRQVTPILTVVLILAGSTSYARAKVMVTVHVRLSPAGSFEATTEQLEGEVLTQEGKVRARELKVPLDTLKTGIALRDEHMKEKYLETKKYPYAVLRLGRGQEGRGSAKLVIRNIEKEISGEYKLSEGYIEASFRISLAEFGIKGVRYMGVGVRDEVTISVKAPTREVPKGIREVARD